MANTLSFTCTSDQYVKLRDQAQHEGLTIFGYSGLAVSHGCRVRYAYDNSRLTLTVESKPWYVPMSSVLGELQSLCERCLGSLEDVNVA